jgi:hypothetical protein
MLYLIGAGVASLCIPHACANGFHSLKVAAFSLCLYDRSM